jgi:hypothetical protein
VGIRTSDARPPGDLALDLADLRIGGAVLLGAGLALPHPVGPGIPCLFHAVTGVPCPLCGMTRSVIATMHLRLHDALAVNPAGVLAVIVAIALLVAPRPRPRSIPTWAAPLALGAVWSLQLLRPLFT